MGSLDIGLVRTKDEQNELLSKATIIPDDLMKQYIGEYEEIKIGWSLKVSQKGNQLELLYPEGDVYVYVPTSSGGHRFHALEFKELLEFSIVKGRATGLSRIQGDVVYVYSRITD
ncbi:MAG: hypothetical protein ABGY96_00495 [bacterium]|nr:hypothetical protein [Gammaproteobacteria bacterium]HIL99177.1 hypothetical protein [Pseudomonadales bacterium]